MANGFQGPPAVDFYSQLSGLGDTLQANAALRQKQQLQAARQGAFSDFTALDPNSPDYGKQSLSIAQKLGAAGDQEGAIKFLTMAQTNADRQHTFQREGVQDKHQSVMEGIALRGANRADDPTPTGWVKDPNAPGGYRGIGPNDPANIEARAKAEAAATIGKPVPFETLSGTKFLIRQPDGSYSTVDPRAINPAGSPAPGGSPLDPTSTPAPGPAGSQTGAPAQPSVAPGAVPGQPQAAPDVSAIDPATGRREAWLKSQPSDVQAYIKKIADYEVDPRTTSIRGGHREQIMSAVANYDPTYDQNVFGSRSKAIKDFSTGQQGNIVRSFDVAIDHLDTLQRAADALKNGNTRIINELRNKWREQTGSELPTDFKALVPIVSGEIAKAVVGSQNALADREELRAGLKTSASPEQLSGVITGYKALMAGQLKGLRKQYEETTGKKNFDSRVRESTRRAILSDEGGKADVTINGYTIKEN